MRRRLWTWIAALATAVGVAACGAAYKLPNEIQKGRGIPSDHSYQMLATWTGMDDVKDILLTQGTSSQLFVVFNNDRADSTASILAFPLTRPEPLASFRFDSAWNPIAMCSGGDGAGSGNNRLFVLDAGDSCRARSNPTTGACGDTVGGYTGRVRRLDLYWRVREYRLLAGDTVSTFTDTTMALVKGIASDDQGRVYVGGTAIVKVPSQVDPNSIERVFQYRVNRYVRGAGDPNMPGCAWHRDASWVAEEGSGTGTLQDPRGLTWSPAGGGALYAADFAKNWVQKLDDGLPSTGFYFLDGAQSGISFRGPEDVAVDLQGFVYVADTGNRRVLRYDAGSTYIQQVDVEPNQSGLPLRNPVTVAANDTLVYVGDRDAGEVIRYKRRP